MGELWVTYALHLARWKARGRLPIRELFSLALTVEIEMLLEGGVTSLTE